MFSISEGQRWETLCGEAVVFTKNNKPKYFLTLVKRQGALLAKGRLIGIQFDTLFTDNLYFDISKHAIDMAEKLKEIIREKGYRFYLESPTNQQFVILPNAQIRKLREEVYLDLWDKVDEDHTVVRFATSWATRAEDVDALLALL